jgi:hypothetical protein
VGSPVPGAVVDAAGAQRSLLIAVAAGALAVLLAALGLRLLRPRFPEGSAPGNAEAGVAPGEEGGRWTVSTDVVRRRIFGSFHRYMHHHTG